MKYVLKLFDVAFLFMAGVSFAAGVLLIFVPGVSWAAIAVIGLGGPVLFIALQALFVLITASLRVMTYRDELVKSTQAGIVSLQQARFLMLLLYNHPICVAFWGLDKAGEWHGHKYWEQSSTEVK